jgi:hypothetical protein
VVGGGCSTFAASIHYPVKREAGIAIGDVKIPTPPPSRHRTGFDFGPGPARAWGRGCVGTSERESARVHVRARVRGIEQFSNQRLE